MTQEEHGAGLGMCLCVRLRVRPSDRMCGVGPGVPAVPAAAGPSRGHAGSEPPRHHPPVCQFVFKAGHLEGSPPYPTMLLGTDAMCR